MFALRGLVCFAAGLGVGLAIAVLATPHRGLANRNFLRRRTVADMRTAARAAHMAEEYASHSATDEGMAEGPVELSE
jgi:hypothetical protein